MLRLEIIGYVSKDATLLELQNGNKVISFSVAHNEKWKDKNGEEVKKTYWVKCNKWYGSDKTPKLHEYLKTGSLVRVEGMPEVSGWMSDSELFTSQELNVKSLDLLKGAGSNQQQQQQHEPNNVPGENAAPVGTDVPF